MTFSWCETIVAVRNLSAVVARENERAGDHRGEPVLVWPI
jgi:hypothetical protein